MRDCASTARSTSDGHGPADLQRLPRKRVTVSEDRGACVTYEGVPVVELLQRAGVPLGKRLRGAQMKLYVIVDASDGYQVGVCSTEIRSWLHRPSNTSR
jgi:hypothetical protein